MNTKHFLEIKFLSFREKPEVDMFKFNGQTYNIKPDEEKRLEIPQSFFDEDESKKGLLKLFGNSNLINECILEIFKGYNYFYCFLDEKGYTFQLLFIKIQPIIKIPLYKQQYYDIIKYDTNNTKDRKRYTFVNANFFSIMINSKYFTIPEFISDFNSYQLSFYDLDKKLVLKRPILLDEDDKNTFLKAFVRYYSMSSLFKEEIEKKIKNNTLKEIEKCLEFYKCLDPIKFYLNKNKSKLDQMFNQLLHIDFYQNILLYNIITCLIHKIPLKDVIQYYFQTVKSIKENNSLKIYQKILLIECFVSLLFECKSKEELEKANFSYYLMDSKEDDSVLDLVDKFFKNYRNKITEESPVFRKLIELDGDSGIYKNESYYCFNMQNLEELKKHLKEIETNIFVIHDLNNKSFAYTNTRSGIVLINVHNIKQYKFFNYPLDKKLTKDNKEIGEIIASKIIYYMLHEINGHKKFSYKKNKDENSPTKFIEDGKIYTLCEKNSNLKGENVIKIVPEGKIGEDGFFYELIYGKIIDCFVFEILDNLNDFSDLLSEVDLWVNDFDSLREYVKYKYALQQFGSDFKSEKSSIKEKINDYKNKCLELQKNKLIYIDTFFTKEKIKKYTKKKTKKESDKTSNLKKEKYSFKQLKDESSSPNNLKKDDENEENEENEENVENEENIKNEYIKKLMTIEEEEEEEEENEGEEEKNKKKISEEERDKLLMKLPYETLLILEQTGILTKIEVNSLVERRKRSLFTSVRYRCIIDNNT